MTTQNQVSFIAACGSKVSLKQEILKMVSHEEGRNFTFGEILADLSGDQTGLMEALHSVTPMEIHAAISGTSSKKTKKKEGKLNVPSIKKDEKEAYKADVLALIKKTGLGKTGRGIGPIEIRATLAKGSPANFKEASDALLEAGLVVKTGKTKGLLFVTKDLEAQAMEAWRLEEAKRAEAEAKRAEAEAKKAKAG